MPFAPSTSPVPHGFSTPDLVVVPQDPAYNLPDYEAVMSSRALLRAWSDSAWPEDGFSLQDNEADLAMHADEHARRIAFGYSLQDGAGRVIGSVYINPLAETFDDYPADEATRARLTPYVARVEWWVRADAMGQAPAIFDALRAWMAAAWPWPVVWGARRAMDDARALYRSRGLVEVARLVSETGRLQSLFG